jgi:hypothetical protein
VGQWADLQSPRAQRRCHGDKEVSAYAVYDPASLQIIKEGIASPDDCELQLEQGFGQAILVADTADELEAQKAELGLR